MQWAVELTDYSRFGLVRSGIVKLTGGVACLPSIFLTQFAKLEDITIIVSKSKISEFHSFFLVF